MTEPPKQNRQRFRLWHRDADVCRFGPNMGVVHLNADEFPTRITACGHISRASRQQIRSADSRTTGLTHAPGPQIP